MGNEKQQSEIDCDGDEDGHWAMNINNWENLNGC
jgi:hypothetical protein